MRSSLAGIALAIVGLAAIVSGISFLLHAPSSETFVAVATSTEPVATSTTTTPSTQGTFTSTGNLGETFMPPTTPIAATGSSTQALLTGMHQTFNEEFDHFSRYVDPKGNISCSPGGSGIWQTVYFFCSRTNANNSEAEVYVDPGFLAFLKHESATTSEVDTDNPFSVAGGILSIKAAPSSGKIISAVGSWAQYTSGMITTQFSFSQKFGYFEMRAKLPHGAGLWPAFWLLPTDKTWPPEIDALEAFGDPLPKGEGKNTEIHYGSHALKKSEQCGGWHDVGTDVTADFHTYGVDIEASGISYYFDGMQYASCPTNTAAATPMYMVINLAVGGPGSWPGVPNTSNMWPAYLQVDYVRAYQKN